MLGERESKEEQCCLLAHTPVIGLGITLHSTLIKACTERNAFTQVLNYA